MSSDHLQVHVHDGAGTIVLNRPERRNALNRTLLADLAQALEDLRKEKRVRAIILTGKGSSFCSGMDLVEMRETAADDNRNELWGRDAQDYRDLMESMLRHPKPIIAAVNGPAVAGGAGLVLACDVVVATHSARFGLPEPLRGITAGVVSPLLVFRIGAGHAARLLMTAELVDSAEAERMGVYHELVAEDQLWVRSTQIAQTCARGAPEALQLTKRMLNEVIGEQLFTQLTAGAAISATARTTEAAEEGLAAFLEKREPKWP
ncbi:MAG: enoyl-CoA hydratase-related protein [Pirellulales bacterium]